MLRKRILVACKEGKEIHQEWRCYSSETTYLLAITKERLILPLRRAWKRDSLETA
jgi:hypothetical protein